MLARSRPCFTRASEKRTSWADDIASSPKRSASAPCTSISSSGSIPVPRLFDIRRPSGAWMTEWMLTVWKGISPVNSSEVMTMRATQRKMMSRAVESTSVGKKALSSGASVSGQPSVANGHSAELNQVSRTSDSCSQPSPSGGSSPT